ncbi:sigma-54 dependent transcriptional regulator [Opitutus sp. GAS368]|jgi:DNA-binding NtrC family response regulator|uniref:sigma-54-dependent transcriptional regulator n=1 Tax=Opitutus sp. GAS368 TaxID=1882749 RepID=UPI000879E56D|nr:sigma-54 dependent transcriptional regulator [Opitutus sp. GAS368]SDS65811.1 DNA-binding transcriptional response regulator, NtrC family, contains REC, AAA-type ATPase, and a Fis-type DNA-binding domains [Opitutus sp. GAS368]
MAANDPAPHRILVADDQPDVLEALRLLLKAEGYQIETVKSPAAVLKAIEARDFSLAIIDLNYARDTTSGQEGLDLLAKLQAADVTLPVVVMTAWASVEIAVEAMRRGAKDFITKPWENPRLLTIVKTQIELAGAVRAYRRLEQENQILRGKGGPNLIAQSAAMRPVLEIISRVGPSDANVLITGENGTGKGVVAQALHAVSVRAGKAFIAVNMGGLPEGVFESELFGHVRGAFTDAKVDRAGRFELADSGTLFMDEIGNIPMSQQAKILRTLETGEFERVGSSRTSRTNVRLISATNSDLNAEVAAGKFRQDLLFRLNTIHLHLPPLRERREDIPLLAQHFLKAHVARYSKPITGFDDAALEAMKNYSWPGNVRELDHSVERGVLMAQGKVVRAPDLGLNAGQSAPRLEDMSLEEVESFLIKKTLARCDGNARKAAEELGLSRSAFYRRLERYKL